MEKFIKQIEQGSLQGLVYEFSEIFGPYAQHAAMAYHDDLNAARHLQKSMLKGWHYGLQGDAANVWRWPPGTINPHDVITYHGKIPNNLGRAWLLAITKALASKDR